MNTMEAMEAAINEVTTPVVKMWLNWMMLIFLSSVVFVWKHKSARFVLGAFLLTLPIAIGIFSLTNSAHLIGIAHLLVWGPLAFYLIKYEVMGTSFKVSSAYGIWLLLLLATIAVSLIFDVRDVTLDLLGKR